MAFTPPLDPIGHGGHVHVHNVNDSAIDGSKTPAGRAQQPSRRRASMIADAILVEDTKLEHLHHAVMTQSQGRYKAPHRTTAAPRTTVNPEWLAHRDARDRELKARLHKRTGSWMP